MKYVIVKGIEVERAIKDGGRVTVTLGGKTSAGKLHDGDFLEKFEDPFGFISAKKRISVAIQTRFPNARFSLECVSSFGVGGGLSYPKDSFINYYLLFEKAES